MSAALAAAVVAAVLLAAALTDLTELVLDARAQGRRRARPRPDGRGALLLAALGRRLGVHADSDHDGALAARVAAAGLAGVLAPGDVLAARAGAAACALAAAVGLGGALPGRLGVAALALAPALGFVLPELWLRRRARHRVRALGAEAPDVLELLRVGLAAGLPLRRALAEVGARHHGLLALELRRTASALELGVPLGEALDELALRAPLEEVVALGTLARRSERHGTPLAAPLGALAADARGARGRALQERAAKAGPAIQVVVAVTLVPSALLLVAAAALAVAL